MAEILVSDLCECRPPPIIGWRFHWRSPSFLVLFFLFPLLLFACSALASFSSLFQWPFLYFARPDAL